MFLALFVALLSVFGVEPDERVEVGPETHVPVGGLMDCLECPSYCLARFTRGMP